MIRLIAAVATGGVIGYNGGIPWDLPEDRRMFKELTMGGVLIMGRRTYESIGGGLPGRAIIVVTSSELTGVGDNTAIMTNNGKQGAMLLPGSVTTAASVKEALSMAEGSQEHTSGDQTYGERDIFFCGGSGIYEEGLKLAEVLYITRVELQVEGDTFFPENPEIMGDFRIADRTRLSANCMLFTYLRKAL